MDQIVSLVTWLGPWIYGLLFGYTLLKSGALPLFAGYASQLGVLDIGFVVVACFAGTVMGDELRFAIGRRWGASLLRRFPRIQPRLRLALHLLDRHRYWYIFGYRYAKGVRTVGALPLGMTPISRLAFSTLNLLAASIWVVTLVGVGYGAGSLAEMIWAPAASALALVLLGGFVAAGWWTWRWTERATGTRDH